ncbi:class I fructose-bisphosphate aldolase [Rhizobium rhizogenes]|uniref:class I fructose-bisphosphate aldolase n=1 Tax=Rhizobium rhizogenes TaxID=359 RepID=UPI0015744D8E|nr:class I fructose-bisphosphate aldolase [Rhizobium rhizogenes]NTI76597.1 fructose-bisphosphate aldolase class I [Rhizobium rhizogenes]
MTIHNKGAVADTIFRLTLAGKGILACDESPRSMGRRLEGLSIPPNFEMRKKFFSMLFEVEGLGQSICGVILYEDMLSNEMGASGIKEALDAQNILIGVRADQGIGPFPGYPGLGLTAGLDSLDARLQGYVAAGARFVKWRAAFSGTEVDGADLARRANAVNLALYALAAVERNLVPIVEIEIEMEGRHTLVECESATKRALSELFQTLESYQVDCGSLILKTNFIVPGKEYSEEFDLSKTVDATVSTLEEVVPTNVPLIAFLSGGQDADTSVGLLRLLGKRQTPWSTSFSFGRALWMAPLTMWAGKESNRAVAAQELARVAKQCGEAVA